MQNSVSVLTCPEGRKKSFNVAQVDKDSQTFSRFQKRCAIISGPSQAPTNLTVTALTSTSVRVSWQLPPADSLHGIKLLYKIRNSSDPLTLKTIQNNSSMTTNVTGLGKYTEYEFQVLAFQEMAFGADGNGPISPVKVIVSTNEDGKKSQMLGRKKTLNYLKHEGQNFLH